MNEITSFNQLFVESARRGLRLNNFFQLENGWFRCSWRAGEWVGAFYDDKAPFLAALNAYVLADLQAPTTEAKVEPQLESPDLFG